MRIGEAAAASGLETTAIRFYEESGVLPAPLRTASGYRDYEAGDIELMRFVRGARSLDIPLDDITQIVELRVAGQAPCGIVRDVMEREAEAIGQRIRELETLRSDLRHLQRLAEDVSDEWPAGPCVCHIVESDTRKSG